MLADMAAHRREECVRHQYPKERSYQRGADEFTQNFRRLGDGAHGHDHPEYGGDDTQRRHRIGEVDDGMRHVVCFLVMHLEFTIHQLFQRIILFHAHGHNAQMVAEKMQRMMAFQKLWIFAKQRAGFGVFDVGFNFQHAFGAHQLKGFIHQGQQLDVIFLFVG